MKTVIVTGASSGIGREFAEVLGNMEGVEEIWVIARRASRLEELKNTIRATVVPMSIDLSTTEGLETYRRALADRSPEVVKLVNAAGFGRFGEFENITLSDQLDMVDLNVGALTAMTYHTIPYMREGGEVYQIASLSSFMPIPYIGVYAATKAYVLSLSRSLNVELKHRRIHVMAVCPSWTRTEFFDRAAEQPDVVVHYGKIYEVGKVVRRAVRDMKKRKDVSICGASVRAEVRLMKLLPHKLTMKLWCMLQKKK